MAIRGQRLRVGLFGPSFQLGSILRIVKCESSLRIGRRGPSFANWDKDTNSDTCFKFAYRDTWFKIPIWIRGPTLNIGTRANLQIGTRGPSL
jgi:hypothetical protein